MTAKVLSTEISIPYGSIKSRPGGGGSATTAISIPYGSIKRAEKRENAERKWQISIPYGSIKSYSQGCLSAMLCRNFNSLWFD